MSERLRVWRFGRALTGVATLVALAIGVGSAAAEVDEPSAAERFAHISGVYNYSGFKPASADLDRRQSVIVEVRGEPVAKRGKLSKEEKQRVRQELKNAQQPVKERIAALGGQVLFDYQDAYNGVAARIAAKDLAELASAPNVVAIHTSRVFERDNTAGVQYIEANDAWNDTGFTGEGVKVAVLDTGVDYTHANFGGPGTEEAFDNNDGTVIEPGTFPTAKVVDGTDLVGDNYNASSDDPAESTPQPDPDPLDCNGHGSHVAGTAAGFGVLDDGSMYGGTYDGTTHSDNEFRIGPGVAPEASIIAIRVFGCGGSASEEVIVAALDAAVTMGANVINMSLGSPFGRTDEPSAEASNNAVDAGVVVVASAGNSGAGAYITGSPAAADKALSVAALDASSPTFPGAVIQTTAGPITAINANDAELPSGSFPIYVLRNPDGSVSLGCDKQQYLDQNVAGKIVVTVRGVCARVARPIFGEQAGAAAVVMINTDTNYPPFEGRITSNPDTGEEFTVTIPFLGVRGVLGPAETADGDNLVASDGSSTTLTATTIANPGYQRFAGFTSGGWRNVDSAVKPEITAPGVSVVSTGVGTGNEAATISGTSMAAPMTAGAAALVVDANPAWSAERVKAALVNTANATEAKILGYEPRRGGAGVVDARKAVDSAAWSTTTLGRVALDFGYDESTTAVHAETQQLTLHNGSGSDITYDLAAAFVPATPIGGASMSFSSDPVTVPAGGSATVDVTLTLDASALPGADASNFGALQSVRGAVVATPAASGTGIYTLRTPFAAVPRGLSDITAGPKTPYEKGPKASWTTSVTLTNSGIHSGTADVYAWGISDPDDVTGGEDNMDVRNAGVQILPGDEGTEDDFLVFSVGTFGRWSNPSVSELDVAIDTKDGPEPDYFVVGVDLGAVLAGSFNGQYASFIFDAEFNLINAWVAGAPMNGSVALLPTLASDIGLTAGPIPRDSDMSHKFRYWVNAFSIVPGGLVDTTDAAEFRLDKPPVSSGDFIEIPAGDSAELALSVENRGLIAPRPKPKKDAPLGWLVVTHDDASGPAQVEEIPIGTP
jgi:minor extracellular serine protease Vpr